MPTPSILRQALTEMAYHAKRYSALGELYKGHTREVFSSPIHRQALEAAAEKWRLNVSRSCVDAVNECMEISSTLCSDDKARDVLDEFWTDNALDREHKDVHEKALTYGDAYIIALPDENQLSGISAYVHSPEGVRVFYNPQRPREKQFAVHSYIGYGLEDDGLQREELYFFATLYFKDVIQRWASSYPIGDGVYTYLDPETVEMRMLDEVPEPIPGTIPVFHFNLKHSRLDDVEGPQIMINETLISMLASIRAAGYRQRYLTAEKSALGGDNFSDAPSDDEDVETKRHVSGPDTILEFLGKGVSLGSFEVSESQNFISAINALLGWLNRIADLPSDYWNASAAPQSGEARRQSRRPLQKVAEAAQKMLGATWQELYQYVLELNNISATAEPGWATQSEEDMDYWDMQLSKQQAGVPPVVTLVEAGYDQQVVDQWKADGYLQPQSSLDNPSSGSLSLPSATPSFEA